jgi:hypothetical protein
VYAFTVMVYPSVAQAENAGQINDLNMTDFKRDVRLTSRHGRTRLLSTTLRDDTIKLIQVCIKFKNYQVDSWKI